MAARVRLPALSLLLGLAWLMAGGAKNFALWRSPAGAGGASESMGATRRQLLGGSLGLVAAAVPPAGPALAFETFKDEITGYRFVYPQGYQKSQSPAYNIFLRDVIEPLESIGVKVLDTTRKSLDEIGDAKTVGKKLLDDILPKGAPREIYSAESKQEKTTGRRYDIIEYSFQWKFDPETAKTAGKVRYQLHQKALITINKKKQFLVVIGCEENRWPVQGEVLDTVIKTFKLDL